MPAIPINTDDKTLNHLRHFHSIKLDLAFQNDRYPEFFIASSGPRKDREEDFLEMILQKNSKLVICLEALVNSNIPGSSKSKLQYSRSITPKRVTTGGVYLRCLAPRKHSYEHRSCGEPLTLQYFKRFDRLGNRTPDLLDRYRCL